jgi:hypothetical protein
MYHIQLIKIKQELLQYPFSCLNTLKLPRTPFFLIGIVGGGVQLGPLGTAATNRRIMPAPGDYNDGEIGGMIGRRNRSTLCPPQTPHAARTRPRAAAVGSQRTTA